LFFIVITLNIVLRRAQKSEPEDKVEKSEDIVEFPLLSSLESQQALKKSSQGPKAKRAKTIDYVPLPGNPIGVPDLGMLTAYGKRKLEGSEDEEEFNRVKCWYSKWNGQTLLL